MKYIDLHTHRFKNSGALEIKNIFAQEYSGGDTSFLYSVGLHPWHLNNADWDECFQKINEAATDKNMVFIGECGLDRLVDVPFAAQQDCFIHQIQIAEKYTKPLIIHCVRAYNDVIKMKKETKSSVPWILHGYNGNPESTLSLVKNGFYFSIGERLLVDERKAQVLKMIPCNSLFFETDESLIPIGEMYRKASLILKMTESELISEIWNNFTNIPTPSSK